MPHIIVEFSRELADDTQAQEMLAKVNQAVASSGLFDIHHIRVRANPLTLYLAGGRQEPFIHCQCRIHVGRSDDEKRLLSHKVLEALKNMAWPARTITVEVCDMDRPTYAKFSQTPE